jgi:hypothetical protein
MGTRLAGGVMAPEQPRWQRFAGSAAENYQQHLVPTILGRARRIEDIEFAVRQRRDHGIVFGEYGLPGIETVDGIAQPESGGRGAGRGGGQPDLADDLAVRMQGCRVPLSVR